MSKEELTTKMHSEFNISDEASIKLTAFMALDRMAEFNYTISQVIELFPITEDQIKLHQKEYNSLTTV